MRSNDAGREGSEEAATWSDGISIPPRSDGRRTSEAVAATLTRTLWNVKHFEGFRPLAGVGGGRGDSDGRCRSAQLAIAE